MKKKFLSLLLCAVTCASFSSISVVSAKATSETNNSQIENTEKVNEFKMDIKEMNNSTSTFVGKSEYQNPPKLVKGTLSKKMDKTFDNMVTFFENNKATFKIQDPANQLRLYNGSRKVFRLEQMVDGVHTGNIYFVAFNDDNQIEKVYGKFDNSLYDENSIAKAEPKITEKEAFEIVKKDFINNPHNYLDTVNIAGELLPCPENVVENNINRAKDIKYTDSQKLPQYLMKDRYGNTVKTYKVTGLSCGKVYVSTETGEIVSAMSSIIS